MQKMQKTIRKSALKACVLALGLSFMSQSFVFADIASRTSYLDSLSNQYLSTKIQSRGGPMDFTDSDDSTDIEASFKLDSKPVITKSKAKIKLSLRNSDIKQVLRMLADKAGINIVIDKSVEGNITLDLNNVGINDAFLIIFKALQYGYTFENNTLTVMTLDTYKELNYTRQNMTVIPVKYVDADSVAQFMNDNLFSSGVFGLSNRPVVTTNPRANQIVVFGTNADVMAIKRVLPVIDTKPLINNFTVNHTTPKEMANLICDTLFYDSGNDSGSKSSENKDLTGEELILGGGIVACRDSGNSKSKSTGSTANKGLSSFKANPLTVTYFPELGRIATIGGSIDQVKVINDFIKQYDKKQLMAYIELSVISLNERGMKNFQNEWNLWTPFISLSFADGTLSTQSNEPTFIWGSKHPVPGYIKTVDKDGKETSTPGYYKSSNSKALVYRLNYEIDNSNGRVITNPKFMVTNGKKTTIDMTSDYVKSVTSQVIESGTTGATQKTYEIGDDNGFKIEIVPFISPDGYVSMNITPEFSVIADNSNPEYTLLQRRDLELRNIRIKDGDTLVLAGLIEENENQSVGKMPFLSDLPFIGVFFRDSNNTKTKNELVIVVTPHIIKDDESYSTDVYNL